MFHLPLEWQCVHTEFPGMPRTVPSLPCSLAPSISPHNYEPLLLAPAAAAAAKSLQSCPTLCDPMDGSPPGSPVPGILQARTRVGCHFLLQCMKVKSESEVTRSCLTNNPMDCSPPGSSIHGIFQARVLEWGAIAFSASTTKTHVSAHLQVSLKGLPIPSPLKGGFWS